MAKTGVPHIGSLSENMPQQDLDDKPVLTPGGWRPKSKVHLVKPGEHVSGKEGNLRIIDTKSGKITRDLGKISKRPRDFTAQTLQEPLLRNAPQPITDTWIVDSEWENGTEKPISYFSSTWTVPPPPSTENNQIIYLFNGLQQTPTGPLILQLVLQWGFESEVGGGNSWFITNWLVGGADADALHGTLLPVNTGDVLQGVITLIGQQNTGYSYLSSFVSPTGAEDYSLSNLTTTYIEELAWACETLECYRLTAFTDYPNTNFTAFTDIDLRVRTAGGDVSAEIRWTANNRVVDNGQECVIVDNASPGGEVDLYYTNGP